MELAGSVAVAPPPTPPLLKKRGSPLAHLWGLAILEGVGVGTAWCQEMQMRRRRKRKKGRDVMRKRRYR